VGSRWARNCDAIRAFAFGHFVTGMPATLQIGLIASSRQTSGSDRYYFNLLRALRQLGARNEGVVLGNPLDVEQPLPGIHSFAPEGSPALRRWSGLRRAVRPLVAQSDVVVSHLAAHVFPVLDIIRERPLVEHFHGPWALEGRFAKLPPRTIALRLLQEASVYRRAKRIVALSRSFAEVLQREYRISPGKIRIVPGGVDLDRFAPAVSRMQAREQLDLPRDRPIVVSVRRLESSKGIDRLARAVELVRKEVPEVLFVIAGTGSLASSLLQLVRERGLEANVRFAGMIDDAQLALLYRAADLSVVPSQAWEGFGLVCLESLASGTPVMVTPIGGLPEVVRDLEPSLIFEGTEVAHIGTGLRDALCGRIAVPNEDACLRYAQGFGWSTIAARVDAVYREVA
jgi:glycosyltransferase involved in cell wall biosynthesis